MTRLRDFAVRLVRWNDAEVALRFVRHEVFVVEQRVPEDLEWDELDPQCMHALAEDAGGAPIGCGRLLPTGYIGRIAVLAHWRGCGVGAAVLSRLIALARQLGHREAKLNAQTSAAGFYARYGFIPVGATFVEANIVHQTMSRPLD